MFEQTFRNIDDVLWKEAGCTTELDYTEQTSWLLFLKYLDDLEQERALEAEFEEPLPGGVSFTSLSVLDGYASEVGFVESMPAGRDPVSGTTWLAHCTGAFAYGRNNGADTASTEFYITLQPQRYLDRNLTVMGRVLDGMTLVQGMPRGVIDGDPETDDFEERLMLKGMTIATQFRVRAVDEPERPGGT